MRSVVDEEGGGDGREGGRCGGRSPSFPYCALSYHPSAGVRIQPSAQSAPVGTQFARTKRWRRVLLSPPVLSFSVFVANANDPRDPPFRPRGLRSLATFDSAPPLHPPPPSYGSVRRPRGSVTLTRDHPAIIRARCVDPFVCVDARPTNDRISGHRPSARLFVLPLPPINLHEY